jgi:hypothetical protein
MHIAFVAILAALAIGCGTTVTPSPSALASPSPLDSPTTSPSPASPSASTVAVCASGDVIVTGGPWGGAAGSRGSDIVVRNGGAGPCLLPAGPTVALVDQAGTALLTSTPTQAGAGPELAPGATVGFSLLFGNWCDQSVSLPLHFRLALASDGVDIEALAVATADDLPPCNGPGQPATLSTTEWQAG